MARRAIACVMPTKVGIHDYGAVRKKGVDGGRSPAMTSWAWFVPPTMQSLLGIA